MQFNLTNAQFEHRPFPICYIPAFFNQETYQRLVNSYPSLDQFGVMGKHGHKKFSLSETYNRDNYYRFLATHSDWQSFHDYVKSKRFVEDMLAFLQAHHIHLGFKKRLWYVKDGKRGVNKWWKALACVMDRTLVSSKFEFSMLSANGGQVVPHTDSVNKRITLVVSFIQEGEWNEAWGGGTSMCQTKDITKDYNHINEVLPFEDTEVIKTFPFVPNQCVLFVKTYNSLHSVLPMNGPENALRKTATIVIKSFS